MNPAIVITGTGLVTPGGTDTDTTWDSVCAGQSAARRDLELDGPPVHLSCRVPGFDPAALLPTRQPWRYDRATQFLFAAAYEAIHHAGLDHRTWDTSRVAVVIGTAAGGIATLETQHRKLLSTGPGTLSPLTLTAYLPNMAAAHLALELGVTGPAFHTSSACASGATAIITAVLLLHAGQCDIALAGGTDAMITPLCAAAFTKMGALSTNHDEPSAASRPFDKDRDGFVLAEGAGLLVLERAAHAQARRARPLAVLAGHGATSDAHHPTAPHPEGRGLRSALTQALNSSSASTGDVDHINAHGTSTRLNDQVEAGAIRDLFSHTTPSVTSVKGVLGHTMGAAGAIEAALTVTSIDRGAAPPTANFSQPDRTTAGLDIITKSPRRQAIHLALSHSLGFGGHNTVLAFARP
ncbi:beta-ketoacyl-[acyl-carrier-protein] synthase family protein [Streptomyces mauvecolor]|uniref:Beta-ketoacyl-[acyl-carrier-protein] synthase family protein n=1 Tax=Streptomyces mauvecolor TaxID=58345 RepID=A0ABV9UYP2_9ACTN